MKQIMTLIILVFTISVIAQDANAADKCDLVGGVPVNVGDPACYMTETIDCNWERVGVVCYQSGAQEVEWFWGPSNTCIGVTACPGKPDYFCEGDWYQNSCKGDKSYYCTNDGPMPSDYTNKVNICHYLTVNTWSDCDENGIQSATSVTQHSITGTNCDNKNEETTRICGICDPATDEQGSGDAPTGNLCKFGTALPVPPTLNATTNRWEWSCLGDDGKAYDDDDVCSAPWEEIGECNETYHEKTLDIKPAEDNTLCSKGTYRANSLTGGVEGPWTWNCDTINLGEEHNVACNAKCFDYTIDIKPNPFSWPTDGGDATIKVSINRTGACSSKYTCDVDGTEMPVDGSIDIDISQPNGASSITVVCSGDGEEIKKTQNVSGYCTSRTCNAQGTCQAISVTSDSHDASACTSLCSSNADCSSGRIIETRP